MNEIYVIPGFKTQIQTEKRVYELNTICGNRDIHYTSYPVGTEYALVVPNEYLKHLSKEELQKAQLLETHCAAIPYSPTVFRFMGETHIDNFFKTGELRLTTFEACGELSDPQRKDLSEGLVIVRGVGNEYSFESKAKIGYTAYILCTSLSEKSKKDDSNYYKFALEILDSQRFMNAIAEDLLKQGIMLTRIIAGPCSYSEKAIERPVDDDIIKGNMDNINGIFSLVAQGAGIDVYFRKPSEKREEHEYRMVFDTTKEVTGHITVHIPEMVPYCRKREFNC